MPRPLGEGHEEWYDLLVLDVWFHPPVLPWLALLSPTEKPTEAYFCHPSEEADQ